ncbi:Avo2 protein [Saccharomycopsis crataegensis]|uniref:Avo2 protein n=1 Tax=Saccharomycopsis crataegensis TaxID=43959 RepID=A0AAV5QRR4_9ASCO|nr:Avo2 protein [Saccharomycopsis crataegensis]
MLDVRLRLRDAIIAGNVVVVKRLLRRFPQHLKNINPDNGWSSLHYAGYYGHYILCTHLVSLGHDRDEISLNFENNAPIHTTVLSGNHQTLLMILQAFPDSLDLKGEKLRSPLHMAAVLNFGNCVDMLIEKGANINAIDLLGNTPLHLAMMYGSKECIKSLMVHNAYIDIRNAEGWLPVEVARDLATEQWFNELKEELISTKYKPVSVIDIKRSATLPSDSMSPISSPSYNIFSNYQSAISNVSSASSISQPTFQKITRTNSDLDKLLEKPITDFTINYKPAKSSPKGRKHSNSSPGVLSSFHDRESILLADDSIEEEPHSPTASGSPSTIHSNSTSELGSMVSPLFPPSIPPAPGNFLPSPGRSTGNYEQTNSGGSSPLKPVEFVSKRQTERKVRVAPVKIITQTRPARSNSNEVYNSRKIISQTRMHSNSVGSQSLHNAIINIGINGPTGGLSVLAASPKLKGSKSSSVLNSPEKDTKQQNLLLSANGTRSRASSVQNMINTPGRYRSNTILSYNSAVSDSKSKQSTTNNTPKNIVIGGFQDNRGGNKRPDVAFSGAADQQELSSEPPQLERRSSNSLNDLMCDLNNNNDITDKYKNENSHDSSLGTHIIQHSDDEHADDSGTDVDSSDGEEDGGESPTRQTARAFNNILVPRNKIFVNGDEVHGDETNTNITFNPTSVSNSLSPEKIVGDQLNFAVKNLRNTPAHQELAKFYSPNIVNDDSQAQFASIDEFSGVSSGLSTAHDAVNPFMEPKDIIGETYRRQNGSNSSLGNHHENASSEHFDDMGLVIGAGGSKRSSILAVPIMSMQRRRIEDSDDGD